MFFGGKWLETKSWIEIFVRCLKFSCYLKGSGYFSLKADNAFVNVAFVVNKMLTICLAFIMRRKNFILYHKRVYIKSVLYTKYALYFILYVSYNLRNVRRT